MRQCKVFCIRVCICSLSSENVRASIFCGKSNASLRARPRQIPLCQVCKKQFLSLQLQCKRTKGPRAVNGQHLSKEFWRASAALPCQFWALGRWSDGGWAEQGQRVPWPGSSVGTEAGLAQREGFGARCHDEKEVAQPQPSAEDLPDKVQLATQRSWICCTPVFPGDVQDVTWPSHLSTRTRIIGFWFLTRKEGTVDGLPIHGMALVCLPVYHQLLEVCGACHFMIIYIYIYWYLNSSPSDGVEN